nr:peroxisomal acyl-coenzyme A oxidase 1-like isoform X1 [Tanacetum cinerariifolium]
MVISKYFLEKKWSRPSSSAYGQSNTEYHKYRTGCRSLKFSCHCFNVSIAEQHAVTFAALATEGHESELINMVPTTTTIDDRPRTRGATNGKSFHKEVSQMDEAEKPLRHGCFEKFRKPLLSRKKFFKSTLTKATYRWKLINVLRLSGSLWQFPQVGLSRAHNSLDERTSPATTVKPSDCVKIKMAD